MYCDENIIIDFELPDYLKESIENLINARKNKARFTDGEESELLSEINRGIYCRAISEIQAMLLRKKYLWWE